ncbi:MAG: peptidylprolyl isomerase [Bacteroidia bacterium]
MAIIGSIRNRMGVLIVVFVGFALLAFILGDFLTTNRSFLGGGNDNSLAVISGEKINPQEFDGKVKEMEDLIKIQQNVENLTNDQQDQARNQAWQQMLSDKIYGKQIEKLGLTITDEEVNDMVFGKFLHPSISGEKSFINPATGKFDPIRVTQYLKQIENPTTPEIAKAKTQWVNFEDGIRKERLLSKYNDLIQKGIYVTTAEAKADYENKGTNYNIKFVNLNYNTISDSSVTVDESDLKNYYESHKWEFKQPENSAAINFVTFDVLPSADDRSTTYKYISELVEPFKTTNNDSNFININSDVKFNDTYVTKGSFSPMLDSLAFSSPVGTVIGPFEEGSSVKIAKVLGLKSLPDSVRARHILITPEQGQDPKIAKAKADSIMEVLKKGGDWMMLAQQFSKDPGSASKGGVYEWFPENQMVKPFNDFCFQNKPNEIGVVETNFGYHIIQVLTHSPGSKLKVKLGVIERKIEPGNATFEAVYQKANQFSGKNSSASTAETFDKAAKEAGLTSRPADNIKEIDKQIGGIGNNCREIVKWVYGAKPGEVSRAFRVDYKFVVALVKNITAAGYKPMEDVKDQLTASAKREKKAQTLIEKANAALANKTIDAVAAKLAVPAAPAQGINFGATYLPGLGVEPAVIGNIVTLKQGELSKAIKGQQGVFVIAAETVTKPAEMKDFTANKQNMMAQNQNRYYEAFNALKEKAQVKDNRGRFY